MAETRVVNISVDEYDIYIGRGSPYGNPFRIGIDGDRDTVIEMYRAHIEDLLRKGQIDISKLKGKRLACYCKPQRCHGDVIVELLEKEKDEESTSST